MRVGQFPLSTWALGEAVAIRISRGYTGFCHSSLPLYISYTGVSWTPPDHGKTNHFPRVHFTENKQSHIQCENWPSFHYFFISNIHTIQVKITKTKLTTRDCWIADNNHFPFFSSLNTWVQKTIMYLFKVSSAFHIWWVISKFMCLQICFPCRIKVEIWQLFNLIGRGS